VNRREFLALAAAAPATLVPVQAGDADIKLHISEITLDLGPRKSVRTLAYNGQVPGPLLRATEGRPITVEVTNASKDSELVHWHGFHIPSEVDGAHQEGTPHVPARGSRSYTFTPRPSGTRWYHSHAMSGRNLKIGTYSGQFGMFVVEPAAGDPARYDREEPILLHEWEPYLAMGGMEVEFKLFSINGKMLGSAEPIRVRAGERVLFRLLNASATEQHRLALAGHSLRVIALDGAPVASPRTVPFVEIAPGERVDAVVEMNNPGIWILGELNDAERNGGMGIVIEYADRTGPPRWLAPSPIAWDYTLFGRDAASAEPDGRIPIVIRQPPGTHRWTINGKSFPATEAILVQPGRHYRFLFDNQSADAHPLHLHRHTFELTRIADTRTSGVFKDVVVVPGWRQVEVDFIAANPGPTLFHCHQQFHMDSGFMAMLQYRD
jgi:FtsP/CotA-like multicopper oxidase with cupredoxin domain